LATEDFVWDTQRQGLKYAGSKAQSFPNRLRPD